MPHRLVFLVLPLLVLLATGCQRHDYIEIKPTDAVLVRKGQILSLQARAMDRQGHHYPEVLFDWSSDDAQVASVNELGEVKAEGSGRTWIAAAAGSVSAKVLVEVNLVERIEVLDPEVTLSLEKNERVAPRVRVYDRKGLQMADRSVFLKPRETGIVTVDGQGGIWPAAIGETTVVANVEGYTGEIKVKVEP